MPLVFEEWDLGITPVTARSRLYSLAPIGIGTAFVESLSGYVARLAAAHAVPAGRFIYRELSAYVAPGGLNLPKLYAVNGVGRSAKRWVEGLESMTLRPDLRYLTLLPFARLFPEPLLLRRVRAWCPACYAQMASRGEPIYEPLAWCLRLVEVCPRHQRVLATACPRCHRSSHPLCAASRPGFCSCCGAWLGDRHAGSHRSDAVPMEYQSWLAGAIGELLANATLLQPERLRDRARDALLAYADSFAEGNRSAVTEAAGFPKCALCGWFRGDKMPRIDTLLRTWYRLRLPVACLLNDAPLALSSQARAERSMEIRSLRQVAPKRSHEQIRAALEEALQEQPAPSLTELAHRLGYTGSSRLREADRDLCRQILLNHRKSGRSHWWRRRGAKPICELSRVKATLEQYLASAAPVPPLDRIATGLGYAVDQSLRRKFPALSRALAARIAEQRHARVEAIAPALEAALQESPPPYMRELAKRLGFSAASVLKAHAPVLYERLKALRQAYEQMRCRELRENLEAVLAENPPPSLKSVYARLGVTESIVNSAGLAATREAVGLRHQQYSLEQAQARRNAVRAEIREIVGTLDAAGICPSIPRVTGLLQAGSLREWKVIRNAVADARRGLA